MAVKKDADDKGLPFRYVQVAIVLCLTLIATGNFKPMIYMHNDTANCMINTHMYYNCIYSWIPGGTTKVLMMV